MVESEVAGSAHAFGQVALSSYSWAGSPGVCNGSMSPRAQNIRAAFRRNPRLFSTACAGTTLGHTPFSDAPFRLPFRARVWEAHGALNRGSAPATATPACGDCGAFGRFIRLHQGRRICVECASRRGRAKAVRSDCGKGSQHTARMDTSPVCLEWMPARWANASRSVCPFGLDLGARRRGPSPASGRRDGGTRLGRCDQSSRRSRVAAFRAHGLTRAGFKAICVRLYEAAKSASSKQTTSDSRINGDSLLQMVSGTRSGLAVASRVLGRLNLCAASTGWTVQCNLGALSTRAIPSPVVA